jgi:formiminotetrahydrofolate cyclodeaminase
MLADLSIKEFLAKTASNSPVPGGGSVAALSASIAASLSEMVANLTIGKKGFEDQEEDMKRIVKEASDFKDKLVQEIDRDAEAFDEVMAAFRLPKGTEKEKNLRIEAIQNALKHASLVPLGVSQDAFKIMELAGEVVRNGNKNAVTDGAVGVMMAKTAVLAALYNVRVNLGLIKDTAFVSEVQLQVEQLKAQVEEKEKEMLSGIGL